MLKECSGVAGLWRGTRWYHNPNPPLTRRLSLFELVVATGESDRGVDGLCKAGGSGRGVGVCAAECEVGRPCTSMKT